MVVVVVIIVLGARGGSNNNGGGGVFATVGLGAGADHGGGSLVGIGRDGGGMVAVVDDGSDGWWEWFIVIIHDDNNRCLEGVVVAVTVFSSECRVAVDEAGWC
ncbi:hypothetical protein Acr_00g0041710 [Actinidia rufa]|uniref:Uncharacterized protein n=1 Tax=Actinidia rufa TaxID=165716 RepID=A0A7J0DI38_9ERIC|nr:hypothetical protein Acr_00g0041710 [Actinidia rufa]